MLPGGAGFSIGGIATEKGIDENQEAAGDHQTTGKPTPFAFPIMVDRMREKLTSEKLEERVKNAVAFWR